MSGGLGEFTGVGPVQARAEALLRETVDERLTAAMAQRSPVGPRAVIVRPAGEPDADASRRLADRLAAEAWVETVAPRPRHVYVRVTTDALREWVADGFGEDVGRGDEGAGRSVTVRVSDGDDGELRTFREAAVGRSIAALVRSRGFEVGEGGDEMVVVGNAPVTGRAEHAAVGEVDVRHGPLRARHGGSVSADDLLGELELEHGENAEALLSFVLLRTERARRLQLDDEKLRREAAAFEGVLAARRVAAEGPPGPTDGGDEPIRDLAAELDLLPIAAARAATALEPAIVTRFIRSIAERSQAAESSLPASDALWSAVGEAIDVALELAGVDVPRGEWCATSQAGVEPEKPRPWAGLAAPTGER